MLLARDGGPHVVRARGCIHLFRNLSHQAQRLKATVLREYLGLNLSTLGVNTCHDYYSGINCTSATSTYIHTITVPGGGTRAIWESPSPMIAKARYSSGYRSSQGEPHACADQHAQALARHDAALLCTLVQVPRDVDRCPRYEACGQGLLWL